MISAFSRYKSISLDSYRLIYAATGIRLEVSGIAAAGVALPRRIIKAAKGASAWCAALMPLFP